MTRFDAAVVGSGFGGAVSALRLAERGLSVVVLEQGRRHTPADLLAARRDPRKLVWAPALGLRGFLWQRALRHIGLIGASGLGGGSIVWGAVLLRPDRAFFEDPAWAGLRDWRAELAPHFDSAERMLGKVTCPTSGEMDDLMRAAAVAVGAEDSFGPVPLGIYFGEGPGSEHPDPFFGGAGPARRGCVMCGGCLSGCPYGSKNSLDLNYLHLAVRHGADIRVEHRVTGIRPVPGGGYELAVAGRPPVEAGQVVLAGGVLGTLELLFRCRETLGTLPHVSPMLGRRVRTNSEALTAVLKDDPRADLTRGPSLSSHFNPDEHTHVTQNRYVGGWHLRFQLGPLVDGHRPGARALATLLAIARHPVAHARVVAARGFERRLTALTVMQSVESELTLELRRPRLAPWRRALRSRAVTGSESPSYLPVANEVTRAFARAAGGRPLNLLVESVGGRSVTAHILGGAVMGTSSEDGVISAGHEVFGHPGLYVADASAIPANLGVNPSLTITAMAERFAASAGAQPGRQSPHAAGTGPAARRPPGGRGAGTRAARRGRPLVELPRAFAALPAPALEELEGDHAAELVGPPWMRAAAARLLALAGLPGWHGKRFEAPREGVAAGVNLVHGGHAQALPMRARPAASLLDGFTAVVVSYGSRERPPWPRVRDELRRLDDDTLLGMTVVDAPGAPRAGFPFLLRRR